MQVPDFALSVQVPDSTLSVQVPDSTLSVQVPDFASSVQVPDFVYFGIFAGGLDTHHAFVDSRWSARCFVVAIK